MYLYYYFRIISSTLATSQSLSQLDIGLFCPRLFVGRFPTWPVGPVGSKRIIVGRPGLGKRNVGIPTYITFA